MVMLAILELVFKYFVANMLIILRTRLRIIKKVIALTIFV